MYTKIVDCLKALIVLEIPFRKQTRSIVAVHILA